MNRKELVTKGTLGVAAVLTVLIIAKAIVPIIMLGGLYLALEHLEII